MAKSKMHTSCTQPAYPRPFILEYLDYKIYQLFQIYIFNRKGRLYKLLVEPLESTTEK